MTHWSAGGGDTQTPCQCLGPDVASVAAVTNDTNSPTHNVSLLTCDQYQGASESVIVLIIQLCLADRDLLIDGCCLISSEVSVGLILKIPDGLNVSWSNNITTSNCLVSKL